MERFHCPHCGVAWSAADIYCRSCGVTAAFLRDRLPAPPVDTVRVRRALAGVLAGLLVLGSGFVLQARRDVLVRRQVTALVHQAMARHQPTPHVVSVSVRPTAGEPGHYEVVGKIALGSLCHGQFEGQWHNAARHLELTCRAHLDHQPAGPPVFEANATVDPQGRGADQWTIAANCRLNGPLPQ